MGWGFERYYLGHKKGLREELETSQDVEGENLTWNGCVWRNGVFMKVFSGVKKVGVGGVLHKSCLEVNGIELGKCGESGFIGRKGRRRHVKK